MSLKNSYPEPTSFVGIGGNRYIVCDTKEKLIPVCVHIGKSTNSIYYNSKFSLYVIRIKVKRKR